MDCFKVRVLYIVQVHHLIYVLGKLTYRLSNTITTETILCAFCVNQKKSLSVTEILEWIWILTYDDD